jgi:hypothetical protein
LKKTIKEVADAIGYSEVGVRKMIRENRLIGQHFERNALGKLVLDEKHLEGLSK